jgi:hypothetical protein
MLLNKVERLHYNRVAGIDASFRWILIDGCMP